MGDEMAHKVLQAEAVGPMTCIFSLLRASLRPWMPIFHALRSHVHSQLERMLSWNGSSVWIWGGEPCSIIVIRALRTGY